MMLCNQCHTENASDAGFCANCGAELARDNYPARVCSTCRNENEPDATFCARCGAELGHGKHIKHEKHRQSQGFTRQKQKKRRKHVDTKLHWHPALVTGLILGGVALLIFILTPRSDIDQSTPQVVETKSSDPAVEARTMDIAAKFVCSCGTCGEKPLDVCTCPTAVQERQFIRNYLQMGRQPAEVIAELNNSFGWIKPEFAKLVNPGETGTGNAISVSPNLVNETFSQQAAKTSSTLGSGTIATVQDRMEIITQFRCPCGQCAIDELKDCTCDHPRGAREVKSFIDQKIGEGTHTVAQIVDLVSARYGGKK